MLLTAEQPVNRFLQPVNGQIMAETFYVLLEIRKQVSGEILTRNQMFYLSFIVSNFKHPLMANVYVFMCCARVYVALAVLELAM